MPTNLEQSSPAAEILAAIIGVQDSNLHTALEIESQRDTLLKCLKGLPQWEDRGWVHVKNGEIIQHLLALLRSRTAPTTFIYAKQENGKWELQEALRLAREGRDKPTHDQIEHTSHPGTTLLGAKLSTLTQAVAYKAIKSRYKKVSRKATEENILAVQTVTKALYTSLPSAGAIWKSIKRKDITRQIRTFLWRCMHGSLRIGKYWRNIPECEDREICKACGETESLEHIMIQCQRPGQSIIWQLAEEIWTKKGHNWPAISLPSILGSGLASFTAENKHQSIADSRFFLILITESAHLIWKLRCECVVGRESEEPASKNEVRNRWIFAMNERLKFDRDLTDRLRHGAQYSIAPSLVLDTWRGVLEDEEILPNDWLRGPEVLVGIAPNRSKRSPSRPVGRRGRNR
ncbi:hypothetical protein B0H19DRAFT_937691 [Mycena capillaripes]|nr:hypothetical protein B0H19DRAFT_937691 [Mycena capillaripes]